MSGQIFISYRRDDSAGWSGRLSDRLKSHFPSNQIFMDVDTIDPGVDFVEAVEEVVGACDVLIAVIGSRWLTSSDRRGRRRLDIAEDLVRLEIATALKRGIRVVPVLVEGATMPEAGELQDDLKPLVRRNALEIGHIRFDADSEHLINAVERALGKARERREREEKESLEAKLRAREEKERLDAERQLERLEAERLEKERLAAQQREKNRAEAEQRERERLDAERREKERLEAEARQRKEEERLKAEQQDRERLENLDAKPTAPVPAVTPPVIATPTVEEKVRSSLERATKEHPWVNSLGMKFVPVAGTQVLFSVWDTRVQDFEAFVKSTGYDATGGMYSLGKNGWKQRGATWKEPGFSQGPTHPVVGVSWNDAEEFCKWLTKRERSAGDLPQDREYRLPTDEEWSAAVGLKNEVGSTPAEKSGKIQLYPWDIPQKRDKSLPPPKGAGNYAGEEAKNEDWPWNMSVIEGYNDGYPTTSPVESFSANQFGLYDMGGNVWEWCEDWYNAQAPDRVLRGASWCDSLPGLLLASIRGYCPPGYRAPWIGFRCVVAVESSR